MQNKEYYGIDEIKQVLDFLCPLFDAVRLVDPAQTAVISFDVDDNVIVNPYSCYKIWNRDGRCENCSSMCAVTENKQKQKFEDVENTVFYIVSKPVTLCYSGVSRRVVLEIVSRASEEFVSDDTGTKTIAEIISETNRKIYHDPLTGCFNRRFLTEHIFLHHSRSVVSKRLGFILLDMRDFKMVNDTLGHQMGDRLLIAAAKAMQNAAIENENVVRIGGDEFVVTVCDCEEDALPFITERFTSAVSNIVLPDLPKSFCRADAGFSYSAEYNPDAEALDALLKTADKNMYIQKQKY